jgi:hypothetical protein
MFELSIILNVNEFVDFIFLLNKYLYNKLNVFKDIVEEIRYYVGKSELKS